MVCEKDESILATGTALDCLGADFTKEDAGKDDRDERDERVGVDSEVVVAAVLYENLLRISLTCAESAVLNTLVSST